MKDLDKQFAYKNVCILDGKWLFCEGDGDLNYQNDSAFDKTIVVPYPVESVLSGVTVEKGAKKIWYKKRVKISRKNAGKRVQLHFGAVNYRCRVFVNANEVGEHEGGYTPFVLDVSDFVREGENEIAVYVENDVTENTPSGKQTPTLNSFGCFYTPCSGIWQSVFLSFTEKDTQIRRIAFYPSAKNASVRVQVFGEGAQSAKITVRYRGRKVVEGEAFEKDGVYETTLFLKNPKLWEVGNGRLYFVTITLGKNIVNSYFGLRDVEIEGGEFRINGKKVYQNLVLDQGYYQKGIYTPSSTKELKQDLKLAKRLGFNGVRMHQKLFSPKYLYYADKYGVMVWGEFPSWGIDYTKYESVGVFLPQWEEALKRDFNHPSIVTWCPLNETWERVVIYDPEYCGGKMFDESIVRDKNFVLDIYRFTKSFDLMRPCIDVSGGLHCEETDICDVHCYESVEKLAQYLSALKDGKVIFPKTYLPSEEHFYQGQPIMVSEFGGIAIGDKGIGSENQSAWGYSLLTGEKAFINRYRELIETLADAEENIGVCYTQLYDIEQEENGLLYYNRSRKFSRKGYKEICKINEWLSSH